MKPMALSDEVIKKMSPEDRKLHGLKTREEINEDFDDKAEKQIQREVEGWLKTKGFWPCTPAFLDGRKPPRGWFFHLVKPKGNMIMLDLIITALDGRSLWLELKTSNGGFRPGQREILDTTLCAKLARSTMEAMEIINEWEIQNEESRQRNKEDGREESHGKKGTSSEEGTYYAGQD